MALRLSELFFGDGLAFTAALTTVEDDDDADDDDSDDNDNDDEEGAADENGEAGPCACVRCELMLLDEAARCRGGGIITVTDVELDIIAGTD